MQETVGRARMWPTYTHHGGPLNQPRGTVGLSTSEQRALRRAVKTSRGESRIIHAQCETYPTLRATFRKKLIYQGHTMSGSSLQLLDSISIFPLMFSLANNTDRLYLTLCKHTAGINNLKEMYHCKIENWKDNLSLIKCM